MADGISLQVAGFVEIEKALRQLPDKLQRRLTGNALRAGARVGKAALERAAPERRDGRLKRQGRTLRAPGYLKRNISVRRAKRGPNKRSRYFAGPKPFYGQYQETGTRHQRARPWMRPAWDSGEQRRAIDKVVKSYRRGIKRAYNPPRPRKRPPRG